ncbi:MAG: c-type cytochrome [Chloroflexota bacterium]
MKYRILLITGVMLFLLSACQFSLASDITPPPDYQSPTPGPTMSPLFPLTPPNLAAGSAIYLEKCAPCHGAGGQGDGPMAAQLQKPPKALGKPEIGRLAAPANWYTTVTEGNINSFMPPFNGSLSDQQRWDVVAYAMSLGGNTAAEAERGKGLYEANCVKCHGPQGNLNPKADFTSQTMMAKLNQTDIYNFVDKGIGKMPGLGGLMPAADIFAVASYVRSFSVSAGAAAAVPTSTPQPTQETNTAQTTPSVTADPNMTAAPTTIPVGSISGKVINGSGSTIPDTLKITLHIFEHNTATQQFSEVATQVAPISSDGSYKFSGVSMPANQAFYVGVNYSNTDYESEAAFPKDGQTNIDLPLTIYETTTDTSTLVAEQAHILLDYSKENIVQVVEFLVMSNTGKKSIVAAEKGGPVVNVALPEGYTNLQFEQGAIGDRYPKTDTGFADTTAVEPGSQKYQLVFAVDLPMPKSGLFGGRKLSLSQPFTFKVSGISVLVPAGITIEGTGFTASGSQDLGTGATYQVFTGTDVEAGQVLSFTSTGTAAGSSTPEPGTNSTQNLIIGIGALGLVLIIIGAWLYLRDRKRSTALNDELDDEDENTDDDQEVILESIMTLDDQFKTGNIKEEVYRQRRNELKEKLKKIK